MKSFQLDIFDGVVPLETIIVSPTKDIPLDVFKQLHRIACFIEIAERLPDGRVLWDPNLTIDFYSEEMAEAEYYGIQHDFFKVNMELPKDFFPDGVLDD